VSNTRNADVFTPGPNFTVTAIAEEDDSSVCIPDWVNLDPPVAETEADRRYAMQYNKLRDRLQMAFVPTEEGGEIHVSLHHNPTPADWWDAGARGADCYAVVSEIVSKGGWTAVVRSSVRTVSSHTVYFFPDKVYVTEGTPMAVVNAANLWLTHDVFPHQAEAEEALTRLAELAEEIDQAIKARYIQDVLDQEEYEARTGCRF